MIEIKNSIHDVIFISFGKEVPLFVEYWLVAPISVKLKLGDEFTGESFCFNGSLNKFDILLYHI